MAVSNVKGFMWICLLVVLTTGCARHIVSQEARQRARTDATLPLVLNYPNDYIGSNVIWGGSVVKAVPGQDRIRFMVLERPLDERGRPIIQADSRGQFILESVKSLDPGVLSSGRMLTVAGEIVALESFPSARGQRTYPVVYVDELYVFGKELYEIVGTYRLGPSRY